MNPAPLEPGDHLRALHYAGRERSYRIHVPPQAAENSPLSILLGMHGGASNSRAFCLSSGLNDKADSAGFLAVYPDGTGQREKLFTWNAGLCCGFARDEMVDDVGFLQAVLDDVAMLAAVDARRVYATGLSNGAMMAYRLAAELADRIAAIAPVAGPMALSRCEPSRPVSVIHLHGTEDLFTPLEGGVGRRSVTRTAHASVAETIRTWVALDGCPPEAITTQLPQLHDDGTRVVRYHYGPGRDNSEVELYIIHGGGHTWPGRKGNTFLFGKSTENLIANDAIWEFLQRHTRDA